MMDDGSLVVVSDATRRCDSAPLAARRLPVAALRHHRAAWDREAAPVGELSQRLVRTLTCHYALSA